MNVILATLKKILFWSYDRGTWQYDVMCVLILAFIFFGPNRVFHGKRSKLHNVAAVAAQASEQQGVARGAQPANGASTGVPAADHVPNR